MNTNTNKLNINIKIFSIVLKLNLLSLNILLNFAMLLGIKNQSKNKDNLVTDIITYLNNQDNEFIDNFSKMFEENNYQGLHEINNKNNDLKSENFNIIRQLEESSNANKLSKTDDFNQINQKYHIKAQL